MTPTNVAEAEAEPGGGRSPAAHRLLQFVLVDASAAFAGAALSIGTYIFSADSPYLLLIAAACVVTAFVMLGATIPLRRNDVHAGLWFLAAANWEIALVAATLTVFTWPVQVLAALLPAVLAPTLVARDGVRLFVVPSIIVAFAAAMLGLLQDVSGVSEATPAWLKNLVLIVAVPVMCMLVALIGVQHRLRLQSALDDAIEARDALTLQSEELRRSRSRIVAAGDRERRRIERDLHDGAQQRLTALRMQIRGASSLIAVDASTAPAVFESLLAELHLAQEELRRLAQGLYPPVLTEHGLVEALRSAADRSSIPVIDDLDDVGRFDRGIEAAVYFCCVEALHNAGKHAGASRLTLSLRSDADAVRFAVTDDGRGFAADQPVRDGVPGGAGLSNMRDRLGAIGGYLEISSRDGEGCTVGGSVPRSAPD